jgi:N-acetylglucosamine-6-phosphate deacetylase
MKDLLITGPTVYSEDATMSNGTVLIQQGKIADVSSHLSMDSVETIEFPSSYHLLPGMIDVHIHGTHGVDVMDATPEALKTMCQALPRQGTTGFLATSMTQSKESIEAALKNIRHFVESKPTGGATILGIHLEGPFISKEMLGAHRGEHVQSLEIYLLKQWQEMAGGLIKMVTLAPELANSPEFIQELIAMNIVPSIGHTNASLKQTNIAIEAGCSHATHLYNAMSGVHHRTPGAAAAILASDKVLAELIVDGHHVSPEMIKATYQIKGKEHLCLVTDAMRAQCQGEGEFDLGGQMVTVSAGQARLKEGFLAGSVVTMQDAFKNFLQFTGCNVKTAMQLTCINPAKQIGCFDTKGSIQKGKDADLIVLNEQYEVVFAMCEGAVCFS